MISALEAIFAYLIALFPGKKFANLKTIYKGGEKRNINTLSLWLIVNAKHRKTWYFGISIFQEQVQLSLYEITKLQLLCKS